MKKNLIVMIMIGALLLVYTNISKKEDATFFYDTKGCSVVYKNVTVDEKHDIEMESHDIFHVSIKSKKGDLNLSIKDSNGSSIYDGSSIPTSEFDVQVKQSDTYVITINGENVSGAVELHRVKQN